MVTIDFHAHCFEPSQLPAEFYQARAQKIRAQNGSDRSDADIIERIQRGMADPTGNALRRDLEATGIQHAVLVGLDWGLLGEPTEHTHPQRQLEWAESVIDSHAGFYSFVFGVDPRRDDAPKLLEAALRQEWVRGVKLYPPMGFSPDDPICDFVYRMAIASGRFVMCHTGRQSYPFDLGKGRVEPYAQVQRRFPDVRLVLCHAGFPFWGYEAIEVATGHPGTALEVSAWQRLHETQPEELVAFLCRAFAELGPSRVLFGTDHYTGSRERPGEVEALAHWQRVFEDAARLSGIDLAESEDAANRLLGRNPAAS